MALGADANSKEFKPVKEFWLLDNDNKSAYGGIKFIVSGITGKVDGILIAGENFEQSGVKYYKCTSPLPFGITLTDDTATLSKKLGTGEKIMARSAFKFYTSNIVVEVAYNDLSWRSIASIKFYNGTRPLPPIPVPAKPVVKKETAPPVTKLEAQRRVMEKETFYNAKEVAPVKTEPSTSPFKTALLNVFKAYRESYFENVKDGERRAGNFWNYHFTYNTKLKIPGEKFNLLYSFPFVTSQLDFVSVIKESDAYEGSFVSIYKEYEKKLLQAFPASEGWKASCILNKESKTLSDLEFTNDHYGSVILDYSRSPKGRHILYLRFLLYSN